MPKSIKQSKVIKNELIKAGYNPSALKYNNKRYGYQALLVQIIELDNQIEKILKDYGTN